MQRARSWQQAWEETLTGPAAFYLREPPERHFSTDAMDGSSARHLAAYLAAMLEHGPDVVTIVDVGAGNGSLARDLRERAGDPDRVQAICVDLRPRPAGLDSAITWVQADARTMSLESLGISPIEGMLIAHELLDDVPCEWIECDADGTPHAVVVEQDGSTRLGPALDDQDACAALGIDAAGIRDWLEAWWPTRVPFGRCEPGLTRDATWARLTGMMRRGLAVAFDYGHVRSERMSGSWDGGTITGYRHGRVVSPNPDGSCNITAHVSLDAVAAAAPHARQTSITRTHGDYRCLVQQFGPE
ncbi:MAG: SAM-dependent methyltransferase [Actinomycetales bacterium]|nr:SAM-dependent methyltransferase [Actinomycetales bacterium]